MAQVSPLIINLTMGVVAQMGATDTVKVGNLGTGTPSTATFLRGDGAWSNALAGDISLSGNASRTLSGDDGNVAQLNVSSGLLGGTLRLFSKDNTGAPGEFALLARTALASKALIGRPDGTLLWGSDAIRHAGNFRWESPGTIGSTTPNTGAFTTLSASGNTTLGDASTDTLNVGNGGIIKDASGNVGIGASPSTDLHITRASNATHFLRLENTTDSTASATVYEHKIGTKVAQFYMRGPSHSSQEWGIYSDLAASPFKIYNNGAVALTINGSGNVGIGRAPSSPLEVYRASGTVLASVYSGSNQIHIGWDSAMSGGAIAAIEASSGIAFTTGAAYTTPRLLIDASGNVGIGAAPTDQLHIFSSASGKGLSVTAPASGAATVNLFNNNQSLGEFEMGQGWASGTDNVGYLLNRSNADIVFGTNGAERLRIDASGHIIFDSFTTAQELRLRSGFTVAGSGGIGLKAVDHSGDGNKDGLGVYGHDGVGIYTSSGTLAFKVDASQIPFFGAFTGSADVACNGYITIKDLAGNTRKLMTTA